MSLNAAQELQIRRAVAERCAATPELGFIIPSAINFNDKADFFAVLAPKINKKEIERTPAQFCCVTLLKFEDDIDGGCEDEPLIKLTYNFYVFREYDLKRAADSDSPHDFLSKVLQSELDYQSAVFLLREEFLGTAPLPVEELPENYSVETNSINQPEFTLPVEACRHIPEITGFQSDFTITVEVTINEQEY